MTLSADKFKDYMNLKADDERTEKYLHGETISVEPGETASPVGLEAGLRRWIRPWMGQTGQWNLEK